jgi:hypothetical protein
VDLTGALGIISVTLRLEIVWDSHLRRSGTKLSIAVIRLTAVATRGFEKAFFMWVSTVRRAVLPSLSTA